MGVVMWLLVHQDATFICISSYISSQIMKYIVVSKKYPLFLPQQLYFFNLSFVVSLFQIYFLLA